jgi:hypothetical protein
MYDSFIADVKKSLLMNIAVPGHFRLASATKRLANPLAAFAHNNCGFCLADIV